MNRRWKVVIIVGVLLGVAILIPVIRHYQLRWELHSYVADLKAKGVPVEVAQLVPPALSPDQNGAEAMRRADAAFSQTIRQGSKFFETNDVGGMTAIAPGKAMVVSQQPDIRNLNGTFSWQEVGAAVNENDKGFALLQQLIDRPAFDFGFNYGDGFDHFDFNKLYLAQSKRAAQRLAAAALVDLHNGDTASAVKNLRAMLALSKAVGGERLLISGLVSLAVAQIAAPVNWELLQTTNATEEELAQLQQDWSHLDFVQMEQNALAMEGAMSRITAEQWRASGSKFQEYLNGGTQGRRLRRQEPLLERLRNDEWSFRWRNWWSYPDELRMLKAHEIMFETGRRLETNYSFQTAIAAQNKEITALFSSKELNQENTLHDQNTMDPRMIFSESAMNLPASLRKVESAEAARQMMIAAIALKRYQLKHGNYPATLEALVPEFVSVVPPDPVDGQPLRYRLKADGTFLLYSVGENGADDSGSAEPIDPRIQSNHYWLNPRALDWVWPQPATDAEIQKYCDDLSKRPRR